MNKSLLIRVISDRLFGKGMDVSQDVIRAVLEDCFDLVTEELIYDEDVSLKGFGRWRVVERAPRQGRHPVTGERIHIPSKKKVVFSPYGKLKNLQ